MTPSASVVMCTFRGERFLGEQLASLRAQTIPPFEVIVQDDGSDDGTLAMLEAEAEKFPAFPLKIFRNEKRLGFAQNFAKAIGRATGDIVFPCDQDDVWEPEKLEKLLPFFEVDPHLNVAFSDALLVDSANRPLGATVLGRNGLTNLDADAWAAGKALPRLLRSNLVPGNCLAIRRAFLTRLLPVPEGWEHDYWAVILAAGLGERIACQLAPLVRYRQHESQVIGGGEGLGHRLRRGGKSTLHAYAFEAVRMEALRLRLEAIGAPAAQLALVGQKRDWLLARSRLPEGRLQRALSIATALRGGLYHRFEAGWSTALKDWLAPY